MILAVDPGISPRNATGIALFDRRLYMAGVVRADPKLVGIDAQADLADRIRHVVEAHGVRTLDALILEWPQVYPHERNVNPNTSLLPLAGLAGHVSASFRCSRRVIYTPREWKGSIPGDVFTQRILDRLDPPERAIVDAVMPAGLRHNAIDAVGLALFYLGRMGRSRAVHMEAAQAKVRAG